LKRELRHDPSLRGLPGIYLASHGQSAIDIKKSYRPMTASMFYLNHVCESGAQSADVNRQQ